MRSWKGAWFRNGTHGYRKFGLKRCARLQRKKSSNGVARSTRVADLSRQTSRGRIPPPPPPSLFRVNPYKTGGGGGAMMAPPTFRAMTRKALATTLYANFLSSFPHILAPNLWRPGVRFWSYVTFCTCTSDWKRLTMWFCVQKSMQIEFFSLSSYKYAYFYSQWLKLICFSIIVLQKVSTTNFAKKTQKVEKTKKYIRNS